ncbi:hypothetical protein BEN74_03935 [Acinetobacter sp. WCHAc010034]|uniref:hypothetical protein n=1 Tax=Acinetobacter sp. WCHAc010034 TaxID=1879049 RepID=UPI00083A1E0D|nr:hypothetical protein [Acinetobacter sp. WCHAc010034]AYA02101.1 hypothetical protein BEN74_03935 [Acinetobacter sp. WCHAc010034]
MFDWLERTHIKVDLAFKEFPKLKYLSLLYVALVILAASFYLPLLKYGYGFNLLGNFPFQNFIAENLGWLVWGQFVVPVVLAIFFYWDISELHDEKYLKKYGQLPKWIN